LCKELTLEGLCGELSHDVHSRWGHCEDPSKWWLCKDSLHGYIFDDTMRRHRVGPARSIFMTFDKSQK
jgi:hypothetical protein